MLVVALIAGYLYTESINKEGNTIMATKLTLTDKQVQALFFAFKSADDVYDEIHDEMYNTIDQVVAKLKKAGWE
tara:strand:+ start:216 stop:437 length:222 start_codon:yes stop_codon:yes gene_type:complete